MIITEQFLNECCAAHTPYGRSWTAAQMRLLGLEYPLPKGWIQTLIGREISDELGQQFYDARLVKGKTKPQPEMPLLEGLM